MAHTLVQPTETYTATNPLGELVVSVIGAPGLRNSAGSTLTNLTAGQYEFSLPMGWSIVCAAGQYASINQHPNPSIR